MEYPDASEHDKNENTYQLNSSSDDTGSEVTKVMVERMIAQKDPDISLHPKAGRFSSKQWDKYHQVTYRGRLTSFAKCRTCNTVYDTKGGTTSLRRHKCTNTVGSNALAAAIDSIVFEPPMSMATFANFATVETTTTTATDHQTTPISAEELNEVNFCLLDCAKEIRQVALLDGPAMRALFQQLINIGAKHGAVDVSQVVPSSRTISRYFEKINTDSSNHL